MEYQVELSAIFRFWNILKINSDTHKEKGEKERGHAQLKWNLKTISTAKPSFTRKINSLSKKYLTISAGHLNLKIDARFKASKKKSTIH